MKAGEKIECQHCGQTSFAKKKVVMDDWTKAGEILVCALCSQKIGDVEQEATDSKSGQAGAKLDALASLLETEQEKKPEISVSEEEKQFCKDCIHFIKHPFITRCSLHDKPVDSMDDCPDFTRKPPEQNDESEK